MDNLKDFVSKYWLPALLGAVILLFSRLLPHTFATAANFQNIVGNQSVSAILGLAAILPLAAGQFDLSIGALLGLTSIAAAAAMANYSAPIWLAVVVAMAIGAGVGLLNGVLVSVVGINSVITTLGVSTIISGLITWYTKGMSIVSGIPDSLTGAVMGTWLGLPRMFYFLAVTSYLVWYLLEQTPFGRYLRAVGSNPFAAKLVGLNVDLTVTLSFVLSGTFVGIAGVLLIATQGAGNPQAGYYYMLPVLAATFLGLTSIQPGKFNVLGTLTAVFFFATVVSGLSLSGLEGWVENIFHGSALILAVGVSSYLEKKRNTS